MAVDSGTLQGLGTVVAFAAFIGVTLWAFSKGKKADFEEAAHLPFVDEAGKQSVKAEDQETNRQDPS